MARSILRCGAGMVLAGILVIAAASAEAQPLAKAPAFTAAELVTLPARNWITNGGNLYNQRYSVLDKINRDNVKNLRIAWRWKAATVTF